MYRWNGIFFSFCFLVKGLVILYLKGLICCSVYLTSRMGQVRCASFSDSNIGLTSPAFHGISSFQQPITTPCSTVLTPTLFSSFCFHSSESMPCMLKMIFVQWGIRLGSASCPQDTVSYGTGGGSEHFCSCYRHWSWVLAEL